MTVIFVGKTPVITGHVSSSARKDCRVIDGKTYCAVEQTPAKNTISSNDVLVAILVVLVCSMVIVSIGVIMHWPMIDPKPKKRKPYQRKPVKLNNWPYRYTDEDEE